MCLFPAGTLLSCTVLYKWLQLIFCASVDEKYLNWPGDCSIVDLMALLLLLLLLTNKFINVLLVNSTVDTVGWLTQFIFCVYGEVVVQVKPFCSLQHDLSSRSVFAISNQIILWQSLFLKAVPENKDILLSDNSHHCLLRHVYFLAGSIEWIIIEYCLFLWEFWLSLA